MAVSGKPTNSLKQKVGRWGEKVAARYLESLGYVILERNYRTPYGEVDLIAQIDQPEGKTIVFVEVKTRRTQSYGLPEQAISVRKKAHMIASAEQYIQRSPDLATAWRLDVIAIQKHGRGESPEVMHFENVFS
jgi:putative endonuclease